MASQKSVVTRDLFYFLRNCIISPCIAYLMKKKWCTECCPDDFSGMSFCFLWASLPMIVIHTLWQSVLPWAPSTHFRGDTLKMTWMHRSEWMKSEGVSEDMLCTHIHMKSNYLNTTCWHAVHAHPAWGSQPASDFCCSRERGGAPERGVCLRPYFMTMMLFPDQTWTWNADRNGLRASKLLLNFKNRN